MTKANYLYVKLLVLGIIFCTSFLSCDPDNNNHPGIEKPNIYIYPSQEMNLSVELEFPKGGEIVKSIPEYKDGWKISVDIDGRINGEYGFLFYESNQPVIWQTEAGWIIKREKLKAFFESNMKSYGFQGQEIIDFNDYWIPKLNQHKFYAIYPQTQEIIDRVIQLKTSKKPDHLLRLFYKIEGFDNEPKMMLTKPKITPFERKGYFVTEWGVTLKR